MIRSLKVQVDMYRALTVNLYLQQLAVATVIVIGVLGMASPTQASIQLPEDHISVARFEAELLAGTDDANAGTTSPANRQPQPVEQRVDDHYWKPAHALAEIAGGGSSGTSTSAPQQHSGSGSMALSWTTDASDADLRVVGWLSDAEGLQLTDPPPRSLLRPPQV